jgi:class 3 adenylate cyclase
VDDHPDWVVEELLAAAARRHRPAWLRVAGGRIVEAGGDLASHRLEPTVVGTEVEAVLPALVGLEAVDEPIRLDAVELAEGRYADLVVRPGDEGLLVILLDRSPDVAERRIAQQLSNDVSLLRDELARRRATSPSGDTSLAPSRVAIVAIEFRGLSDLVAAGAGDAAARLAAYLVRASVRPLIDEGGVPRALEGETITAAFGLLPASAEVERLAISAAIRALDAAEEVLASSLGTASVRPAAAVAAGPLLVGAVATRSFHVEAAVGEVPGRARALAAHAPAGALAVERSTLARCPDLGIGFEEAGGPDAPLVRRSSYVIKKETAP